MRRVFWFTVGAGVGVFVILKAREYARRATPQAVQQRFADASVSIGDQITEFGRTLTSAMHEREAELRDALGLDEQDARATQR